jgi:hypothetical protein
VLRLVDQFNQWTLDMLIPRYFCTPTDKQSPEGFFPIVDPEQNYVCYEAIPPDPATFGAMIRDQFIQTSAELRFARWVCVPTDKHVVTSTQPGQTWGRIKMLYR